MNNTVDLKNNLPLKYQNVNLIKQFKSRKNAVYLIERNNTLSVLKWFIQKDNSFFENDLNILSKINFDVHVPSVISVDHESKIIIMNYIEGDNLCDKINDSKVSIERKIQDISNLAGWLISFHNSSILEKHCLIKGDAHLRNFIIDKNNNLWGIDFEESRNGNPSEDLAEIIASILTTDPVFTKEKMILSEKIFNEYQNKAIWEIYDFQNSFQKTLKNIIVRRNLDNQTLSQWNGLLSNTCFK